MNVETTLSIGVNACDKITAAAEGLGISRRQVISSLLNYTSRGSRLTGESWSGVRYRHRKERWKRLHINLRCDEYEFFIDMRKVFKMSVSHIVDYATEHYLDELLLKMQKGADNYRYRNYAMTHFQYNDVACWVFYWGIPGRIIMEDGG